LEHTLAAGWQLVANPYPSYYQLPRQDMSGADFEHTTGSVYARTGSDKNNRSLATYNTLTGISTPSDFNGIVAPMQAFWVKRETAGVISMKQANRIHDEAKSALKSAAVGNRDLLRLQLTNNFATDEAVVALRSVGSFNLTRYDSEKRFESNNMVPYIYSLKENKSMVINVLPKEVLKQSIPLGIRLPASGAGELTIAVNGLENMDSNLAIYLEDKVSGAMVDLRSTPVYTFTAEAATINDRLVLHFDEPISTDIDTPEGEEATSVYAYQKDGELMVFENLLIDQPKGDVQIEVISMSGARVLVKEYATSGLHVIPANLASGIYIVKVSIKGEKPHTVKVILR